MTRPKMPSIGAKTVRDSMPPPEDTSPTDYVLEPLGQEALPSLETAIAAVADRVSAMLARRPS